MFSPVSVILSTGGGGVHPLGRHPLRQTTPPPPGRPPPWGRHSAPETATTADGTHPTGMHSCYLCHYWNVSRSLRSDTLPVLTKCSAIVRRMSLSAFVKMQALWSKGCGINQPTSKHRVLGSSRLELNCKFVSSWELCRNYLAGSLNQKCHDTLLIKVTYLW